MVVGFVLKQQQPGLGHAVHGHVHLDGAGVDFLGLVQLVKLSVCPQVLDSDGSQIHQADGLVLPAQSGAGGDVLLIGLFQQGVFKADAVDDGSEGGVAAVIGPVGVDHADLGDGGVPVLGDEIGLAEGDIVQVHGKAVVCDEVRQTLPVQLGEAVQSCHFRGNLIGNGQSGGNFQRSLPALHGVDDVLLKFRDLGVGKAAVQGIDLGGADQGTLPLRDDLDTLGGGICPLIELTGQGLYSEHISSGQVNLGRSHIQLRLGEYRLHGVVEQLLCDIFRVIAVEQPDVFQSVNAKKVLSLAEQPRCLVGKTFLFLNKYAINHRIFLPFFCGGLF